MSNGKRGTLKSNRCVKIVIEFNDGSGIQAAGRAAQRMWESIDKYVPDTELLNPPAPNCYYIATKYGPSDNVMFWRADRRGYTTRLLDALKVDKAKADLICAARPHEDWALEVADVNKFSTAILLKEDLAKFK